MGPFEQLFDFLKRSPVILPVTVTLLSAVAVFGVLRIDFEEDILALLPADEPMVGEAQLAIERFEGLERIVIALESDDAAELAKAVDRLDTDLRETDGVTEVVSRIDSSAQDDIADLYLGNAPLLFDKPMQAEIEQRLTTVYFQEQLQRYLNAQAGAEGIKIVDTFRSDPFGFDELTLRRFENLQSGFAGKTDAQGRILSADGRLGVVFVDADFPSSNTGRGRVFMDGLHARLADLPEGVSAHIIGAHRSSVDNAEVLRTDMHLTVATSVIGILLLFFFAFRALTPIIVTLSSVGFGFVVALGSQGLVRGELSAITAGFAAVLLGISVDYAIHLVTTYGSLDGDRETRARASLAHVARPGVAAMLTTGVAIFILRFSAFDGLHQLAEMAIAGIAGSLVFAFAAGPQLLRKFGPKPKATSAVSQLIVHVQRLRRKAKLMIIAVLSAATVVLALFLPGVEFDGDVMNLDGKSSATAESEALIQKTFGQETLRRTLVVVGDDDLNAALRSNDLVARDLYEMGAPFESAAWVLPAPETQRENTARWRKFWNKARIAELKKTMAAAKANHPNDGREISFSEDRLDSAFSDFFAGLRLAAEPPLLEPAEIQERPVWLLLSNFVSRKDGKVYVGTTAQMEESSLGLLKARQPSALVLNKAAFAGRMIEFIRHDLLLMGGLSLLLVLVVLWVTFGQFRYVVTALVPVVGAMTWTLGLMSLIGIPFNIINTLVTVFIAGLGIDYGIFFVQTYRGSETGDQADERLTHAGAGVLVAALTTLFGFGSLALADHPALFSVGVTTAIGVASALILTLLAVPTLLELERKKA